MVGSNVSGMKRAAPRTYVPSRRIKNLHRGMLGARPLKALARSGSGMLRPPTLGADWLRNKRGR